MPKKKLKQESIFVKEMYAPIKECPKRTSPNCSGRFVPTPKSLDMCLYCKRNEY